MGSSCHVVKRRLKPTTYQINQLEAAFELANWFYNDMLEEIVRRGDALRADAWYLHALGEYLRWKKCQEGLEADLQAYGEKEEFSAAEKKALRALKKELKRAAGQEKLWVGELAGCREAYGFSEYGLHAYATEVRSNEKYDAGIGINIAQKLATAVWSAEKKVFYGDGKRVHFRKKGQTTSIEDKKAESGIIYHPASTDKKGRWVPEYVSFRGMKINLKAVRETDIWLQQAMGGKIKYCRLVREPFGKSYRYFLQIVMGGNSPVKHPVGNGCGGIDPGVSTMSYDTDEKTDMVYLSPDIEKYRKEVRRMSAVYERRRRMENPENFNADGTVKKDTDTFRKVWKHTKGTLEAALMLKSAYRKMAEYVKQSNGHDTNIILKQVSTLWIEGMDYTALAKKVKETARQEKATEIKQKDGTVKSVHKYKRKKRFGSSILKHAPGSFIQVLTNKIEIQGGEVLGIDTRAFKASQYDHVLNDYRKAGLSDRTKLIDGHRVQRDCYSAFLMHHAKDKAHTDREACTADFRNFLRRQGKLVGELIRGRLDPTGNFGLKDFVSVSP